MELAEILKNSNNIVFLGGAGVSTESGIPDFRGEKGILKARNQFGYPPEVLISHTFFENNPKDFFVYYKENLLYPEVQPNDAHFALARLEALGKLRAVITQNIDGLHQMAGSKEVLELHGSVHRNYCLSCRKEYGLDDVLASEETVPKCGQCGGIIRPDVVLYEEPLNENILRKACRYMEEAEVLIVGGTSLNVYPAAGLLHYYKGSRLVLINISETPFDSRANLVIHKKIGETLQNAVACI